MPFRVLNWLEFLGAKYNASITKMLMLIRSFVPLMLRAQHF